jgi:hypothetical protein
MDNKAIEALKQHIDQAAARLQIRQDEDAIGSLIYMGNHQDAVPRELIIDPILESGEIHTWMLMKVNVNNPVWFKNSSLRCSPIIILEHAA